MVHVPKPRQDPEHKFFHLARVDRKIVDGEQIEVQLTLIAPEQVVSLKDGEEFCTLMAAYNLLEDPRQ